MGCHVPFTAEWLPPGHSTIKACLVECYRAGSPISTEKLWSSVSMIIGFLVTSLTNAFLPRLLSLTVLPVLGRVLVVPNFFHLRMMEATVLLGIVNAAEMFLYPSPDLCLDTILSQSSTENSFDLMDWFLL